jgi:hypothetical protein
MQLLSAKVLQRIHLIFPTALIQLYSHSKQLLLPLRSNKLLPLPLQYEQRKNVQSKMQSLQLPQQQQVEKNLLLLPRVHVQLQKQLPQNKLQLRKPLRKPPQPRLQLVHESQQHKLPLMKPQEDWLLIALPHRQELQRHRLL